MKPVVIRCTGYWFEENRPKAQMQMALLRLRD
jgi:hypothetical protein